MDVSIQTNRMKDSSMAISVGDKLPSAALCRIGDSGPESVELADFLENRKVVIFAVPGAFTPTCSEQHVPSFVRNATAFAEKGIDEIICVSVNDPFVMKAWGQATGADEAGVTMLGDPQSAFTKAIGLAFSAPPAGLFDRSARYSMYVDNGVVKALNQEDAPGVCGITSGDELLGQI